MTRVLNRVLLAAAITIAAGCALSKSELPESAQSVRSSGTGRQLLVTVQQADRAAMRVASTPGQPYLRRGDYQATPTTERILEQLARDYQMRRVDGWPIRSLGVHCEVFTVDAGTSIPPLLASLSNDSRVELAQPMNQFSTLSSRYNDPYLAMQSGFARLEVESAHRWATGRGVTVAVIDSGVENTHPDLRGRLGASRDFVGEGQSGAVGEIHGTAVAGVIASVAGNRQGIVGVAPDVRLAALRACWQPETNDPTAICNTLTLAKALDFALDSRPQIINLSLSGPEDPLLARLVSKAVSDGLVVITAEPPSSAAAQRFPSAESGVIVVGAGDAGEDRGAPRAALRLTAPGTDIFTTAPRAGYGFLSGSSLAAAHVSGVAALLLERESSLSAADLTLLMSTRPNESTGVDGVVNACRAVTRLLEISGCSRQLAGL
jgi:hypothetical protein